MPDAPAITSIWSAFLESRADLSQDLTYYEAFTFGTEPESVNEIARLVVAGTKAATSEALRVYEESGQRPPQPGDFSVVLDGSGDPVCVMETLESRVIPFNDVNETFAYDYGEGDQTLSWWRDAMWEYYEKEFVAHGWTISNDVQLVCERFRVVFVPDEQEGPAREA